MYKLLCVSLYTSCDSFSLHNRFLPFQFAITFHKIIGFPLEARFLIIHIQLKDVSVIKENQKLRTISYTARFNQHQSAICALYTKGGCGLSTAVLSTI